MTNERGSYSSVPGNDLFRFDLNVPVEGLRAGWQKRLVGNYRLLHKQKRAGFLFALRMIADVEQLPPAYYRSLPIARLAHQLVDVIIECERMNDPDSPA